VLVNNFPSALGLHRSSPVADAPYIGRLLPYVNKNNCPMATFFHLAA
jgi:hypothetical protein